MTVKQFVRDFSAFIFGLVGASFTLGLALSGAFDWSAECLVLAVCCCFVAAVDILAQPGLQLWAHCAQVQGLCIWACRRVFILLRPLS